MMNVGKNIEKSSLASCGEVSVSFGCLWKNYTLHIVRWMQDPVLALFERGNSHETTYFVAKLLAMSG